MKARCLHLIKKDIREILCQAVLIQFKHLLMLERNKSGNQIQQKELRHRILKTFLVSSGGALAGASFFCLCQQKDLHNVLRELPLLEEQILQQKRAEEAQFVKELKAHSKEMAALVGDFDGSEKNAKVLEATCTKLIYSCGEKEELQTLKRSLIDLDALLTKFLEAKSKEMNETDSLNSKLLEKPFVIPLTQTIAFKIRLAGQQIFLLLGGFTLPTDK